MKNALLSIKLSRLSYSWCTFSRNSPIFNCMKNVDNGFTLIELLVVISIAGIFLGLGAPSLSRYLASNQLTGQHDQLIASLALAKSEAIKRGGNVTICSIASQGSTTCDGTVNWQLGGWLVTAGGTMIRKYPGFTSSVQMVGTANSVTFDSMGVAGAALALNVCDSKVGVDGLSISVAGSGQIRTAKITSC